MSATTENKPQSTTRAKRAAGPKAAPKGAAGKKAAAEKKAKAQPDAQKQAAPAVFTGFRVGRDEFARAIAWTARSLPSRPSVPVLAGIRLDLADGELRLSAFDYEVSAEATVPATFDGSAQLLLPGKVLAEIVHALPAYPIDVAVHGVKVTMTCGPARFTLLTMPVEDYPNLPEAPPLAGRVDGATLAAAVAQTAVAASRDETLPMLTGVRLEIADETVTVAATDRYRLAVRELAWRPHTQGFTAAVVVPAKVLASAAKAFAGADEVEVSLSGPGEQHGAGMLCLSAGGLRTTTRLLDPEFPKFRELMPTEFTAHADLPAGPFVETVKRVALVAERDTPIRLTFAGEQVTIEAGTGDEAQGVEVLPVTWSGEEMAIAFNHAFLLEAVGAAAGPTARLNVASPLLPAVFVGVADDGERIPGYEHLLMPIRLAS
ncbi:DNA polymerase III subunit beta [Streptosporangium sp. NPDC002721]|uniref:DNA polymerase III subunit beta n=1 Tax=Streptosporangium sp. NPDC002721 TaxID=3366188 RepID=UPI0036A0B9A4